MKKILMLSQTIFPPDIRLEKEIKSLNTAGYDITVLCNKFENTNDTEYDYCKIERLSAPFSKKNLNKIINFPIFFNPRYISRTLSLIVRKRPDYIHAHDLPMVPLALLMKLLFGIPVIYDMHENYPEALKVFKKKGLINLLFKNYRMAKILDRFCIKYSDRIITVVEENKKRLLMLGVNSEKVSVVSNTVDIDTFGREKIDDQIAEMYQDKFVIIYAGRVNPERGLETPILSISMIREKMPEVLLLILGNGPAVNYLTGLAKEKKVENHIRFIPWMGHDKVNSFLSLASVCIIAWPNNEFTNTTIPHKLFEYMSQGKPVLVSDTEPLKRIVTETQSGKIFRSNDPHSFAEEILKFKDDTIHYGENGRNAVLKKYNWQYDGKNLIDLYQSLN